MEVGTLSVVYTQNEKIVRYLIILLYFLCRKQIDNGHEEVGQFAKFLFFLYKVFVIFWDA